VLKQGQFEPVPVAEQVVVIFAVTAGYTDGIEVSQIAQFEVDLVDHMRTRHSSLLDEIAETGGIDEEAVAAAIEAFAASWTSDGA
jgi:F-type H+-transporting ATPase subunit alpha